MTVKELIAELQTLDPDLRVFTDGYEGGYEDVVTVGDIREIALSYHEEWWYGPHVDSSQVDKDSNYKIVKGVVL
jgi:hypothetical protein